MNPGDTGSAEQILGDSRQFGDTIALDLWYPRSEGAVKAIEVGLVDVRAADAVRISYDFERDGWSIQQAANFCWDADDEVCDPDWQEVAFVRAWAREVTLEEREKR